MLLQKTTPVQPTKPSSDDDFGVMSNIRPKSLITTNAKCLSNIL